MLFGIVAVLRQYFLVTMNMNLDIHFMNEILGVIFQIKAPKQYFVLYYAVQGGSRLTFEFDDA